MKPSPKQRILTSIQAVDNSGCDRGARLVATAMFALAHWLSVALGWALLLGVPLLLLVWNRQAVKLKLEKKLAVRVERDPGAVPRNRTAMADGFQVLSFLDLDSSLAAQSPLQGLQLLSLGDYFASLVPHGGVSWERAAVSVADRRGAARPGRRGAGGASAAGIAPRAAAGTPRVADAGCKARGPRAPRVPRTCCRRFGLTAALPLAMFLPAEMRKEGEAGSLLKSFPSLAASHLVTSAISALDLVAFGQTVHLYASRRRHRQAAVAQAQQLGGARVGQRDGRGGAAGGGGGAGAPAPVLALAGKGEQVDAAERVAAAQLRGAGPLAVLLSGGGASGDFGPGLPNPLLLSEGSLLEVLGITAEQAADQTQERGPEPKPVNPLLPDLHIGNGGLMMTHSTAGGAACRLMAAVCNLLAANALDGLGAAAAPLAAAGAAGRVPFAVRLREGGPGLTSVEALATALQAEGYSVDLKCNSNLTSFGIGFCVPGEAAGTWRHIPIAYPLRTGLWARDEQGQEASVMTLMSHGSVLLSVRGGPLRLLNFDLEWCLGVSGFTGWLPYAFADRVWATGDRFRIGHPLGDLSAPGEQTRLLRLLAAATCVLNVVGQRDRLLFGGYGYLGVCLDSAAVIQQAMAGTCTLYPLILGGDAKCGLMAAYLEAAAGGGWAYAADARALATALADLPCDAIQEPCAAACAARRALACLPRDSVFAAVGRCRAGLEAALAEALALCPESYDGVLEIKPGNKALLYDTDGKVVGQSQLRGYSPDQLGEGSEVLLGSWELEVCEPLPAEKFRSGEAFLRSINLAATAPAAAARSAAQPVAAAGGDGGFQPPLPGGAFRPPLPAGAFRPPGGLGGGAQPPAPRPIHDPHVEGAVVLNPRQWQAGAGMLGGRSVSPVVLDPYIGRQLRPHQVEGVRFLYETVMGLREQGRSGCILADEMGLGKTVQVLALIWTLTKQGPMGCPSARKALVVTPSSVAQNWAAEARKWLGNERMRCIVNTFVHGQAFRVACVSYENVRKHADALKGAVDLLVCDEGHRLKSAAGNKTISALTSLGCQRHVLLTGTPVQNNPGEFFAMVDFVVPGLLGDYRQFERLYGATIARGREKNATPEEQRLGEARSQQLMKMVQAIFLRRTNDLNSKFLPPCTTYVACCAPAPAQLAAYRAVLGGGAVRSLLHATGADFGSSALSVLNSLRKISNHPALYSPGEEAQQRAAGEEEEEGGAGGAGGGEFDPDQSGKMAVLATLLQESLEVQGDRCVVGAGGNEVVSQSTATLDLVAQLCAQHGWKVARLDGSTSVAKRQDIVDAFNRLGVGQMFQRQLQKGDMAATLMGQAGGSGGGGKGQAKAKARAGQQFSKEELRRLFTLNVNTRCDTYDLLNGAGAATGGKHKAGGAALAADAAAVAEAAASFRDVSASCGDAPLAVAVAAGRVTFVHLERREQQQQE
eukprot:scaffold7.g3631.t1